MNTSSCPPRWGRTGSGLSRFVAVLWLAGETFSSAMVTLERLPTGSVQPALGIGSGGGLHLVCLEGDAKAGDVVYRHRGPETTQWSAPLRVNSAPGSAIAIGTIRGAQVAVGVRDTVHVVWNGSGVAEPKPPGGGVPLLYARLSPETGRFSEQRNLMRGSAGLDGGGSVAADRQGNVWAFWHGALPGSEGETNRVVFVAQSLDNGVSFEPERAISPSGSGACGCCGLAAAVSAAPNELVVLFRTAATSRDRDMSLLSSLDHGRTFRPLMADAWSVGTCPMSSASFLTGESGSWAMWETAGQIRLLRRVGGRWEQAPRSFGPGKGAKHPRLATNRQGRALLVWTEGTGWQRGGAVAWQVLDDQGQPTADRGRQPGVPAWSFAVPYAKSDGTFGILY